MNIHDTIETELTDILPEGGLEVKGVYVSACALAAHIEKALRARGHLRFESGAITIATPEDPNALAKAVAREFMDGWPPRTNLDRAAGIVQEIERTRQVQRELKAAFARSELDGGVKAAPKHPLYVECEEALAQLHDQLMLLI